ncbi:unnamed protein product [Sphagnum balticum]
MADIPGASNALPGVFTDVITQSAGASIPGGSRVAAIIGEGTTNETIVSSANGGGNDGLTLLTLLARAQMVDTSARKLPTHL